MKKELKGYDTDYYYSINNPTPVDAAIDALNYALMPWNYWWITYDTSFDSNNNVILELRDDTPTEIIKKAKKLTAKVLEAMWATQEEIQDLLARDPKNEYYL